MNRYVLTVLKNRSQLSMLYGVVLASKLFGIRNLTGWIRARWALTLFQRFFKKSEPNPLQFRYLQQRHGQHGIREIKLDSLIILCPFVISQILQKITLATSGVWINPLFKENGLFLASGHLQ